VWANIGAILSAADMAPGDVVSVTTYVVLTDRLGEDLAVVMAARDTALAGTRAASTLVTVPALARPQWKLEITVVAAR
jgi:enamine deaminase RidA (YjgF/YER057c/UK114 family)